MRILEFFFEKTAKFLPPSLRKVLTGPYQKLVQGLFAIAAFPNSIGPSPLEKKSIKKSALGDIWTLSASKTPAQRETWSLNNHEEKDISEIMQKCFNKKGLYPISFSIPVLWSGVGGSPKTMTDSLSNVFPGQKYAFTESSAYMTQYSNSALGLTFKKGGWDCFRHLEIISAGSLPLMPDIHACPEFTMVHYPKKAFEVIEENFRTGLIPDESVYGFVFDWAKSHLTSVAMVQRMFDTVKVTPERVLFVDEHLPKRADYLSVLTLIGLFQSSSIHVDVAFPVDYIFQNWGGQDVSLYGRGFGYSRVIGPEFTGTAWCSAGTCRTPPSLGEKRKQSSTYDLVIVGDISSNRKITKLVQLGSTGAELIFIRGDDKAPTRNEYKWLRELSGYVFSREIY